MENRNITKEKKNINKTEVHDVHDTFIYLHDRAQICFPVKYFPKENMK